MLQENIDALSEIFSDYGVIATDDQVKEIAQAYDDHLDAMRDMSLNQHISVGEAKCANCDRLRMEIDDLNREIDIFKGSVKQRTGANTVWVDKTSNTVRYDF